MAIEDVQRYWEQFEAAGAKATGVLPQNIYTGPGGGIDHLKSAFPRDAFNIQNLRDYGMNDSEIWKVQNAREQGYRDQGFDQESINRWYGRSGASQILLNDDSMRFTAQAAAIASGRDIDINKLVRLSNESGLPIMALIQNPELESYAVANSVAGRGFKADSLWTATTKELYRTWLLQYYGVQGTKYTLTGMVDNDSDVSEEDVAEYQRLMEIYGKNEMNDWFTNLISGTAGLVAQQVFSWGPAAALGVLTGGTGAAFSYMATHMFMLEGGNHFMEMTATMRDENGNRLPVWQRAATSALVGAVNSAIEMGSQWAFGQFFMPIGTSAMRNWGRNAILRTLAVPGARNRLWRWAAGAASDTFVEASEEFFQDGFATLMNENVKRWNAGLYGMPDPRGAWAAAGAAGWAAWKEVAGPMALMSLLGGPISYRRLAQAEKELEERTRAIVGAETRRQDIVEDKLRARAMKRNPDMPEDQVQKELKKRGEGYVAVPDDWIDVADSGGGFGEGRTFREEFKDNERTGDGKVLLTWAQFQAMSPYIQDVMGDEAMDRNTFTVWRDPETGDIVRTDSLSWRIAAQQRTVDEDPQTAKELDALAAELKQELMDAGQSEEAATAAAGTARIAAAYASQAMGSPINNKQFWPAIRALSGEALEAIGQAVDNKDNAFFVKAMRRLFSGISPSDFDKWMKNYKRAVTASAAAKEKKQRDENPESPITREDGEQTTAEVETEEGQKKRETKEKKAKEKKKKEPKPKAAKETDEAWDVGGEGEVAPGGQTEATPIGPRTAQPETETEVVEPEDVTEPVTTETEPVDNEEEFDALPDVTEDTPLPALPEPKPKEAEAEAEPEPSPEMKTLLDKIVNDLIEVMRNPFDFLSQGNEKASIPNLTDEQMESIAQLWAAAIVRDAQVIGEDPWDHYQDLKIRVTALPFFDGSIGRGTYITRDGLKDIHIRATDKPNSATYILLHEGAHMIFDLMLNNIAWGRGDAKYKADWAILAKWLKVEDLDPMAGANIEEYNRRNPYPEDDDEARAKIYGKGVEMSSRWFDAHEHFVSAFMQYLYYGKAPSREVRSVFEKVKTWLKDFLDQIMRYFYYGFDTEVREVFDRMLSPDMRRGQAATETATDITEEPVVPTLEQQVIAAEDEDVAGRLLEKAYKKAELRQMLTDRGVKMPSAASKGALAKRLAQVMRGEQIETGQDELKGPTIDEATTKKPKAEKKKKTKAEPKQEEAKAEPEQEALPTPEEPIDESEFTDETLMEEPYAKESAQLVSNPKQQVYWVTNELRDAIANEDAAAIALELDRNNQLEGDQIDRLTQRVQQILRDDPNHTIEHLAPILSRISPYYRQTVRANIMNGMMLHARRNLMVIVAGIIDRVGGVNVKALAEAFPTLGTPGGIRFMLDTLYAMAKAGAFTFDSDTYIAYDLTDVGRKQAAAMQAQGYGSAEFGGYPFLSPGAQIGTLLADSVRNSPIGQFIAQFKTDPMNESTQNAWLAAIRGLQKLANAYDTGKISPKLLENDVDIFNAIMEMADDETLDKATLQRLVAFNNSEVRRWKFFVEAFAEGYGAQNILMFSEVMAADIARREIVDKASAEQRDEAAVMATKGTVLIDNGMAESLKRFMAWWLPHTERAGMVDLKEAVDFAREYLDGKGRMAPVVIPNEAIYAIKAGNSFFQREDATPEQKADMVNALELKLTLQQALMTRQSQSMKLSDVFAQDDPLRQEFPDVFEKDLDIRIAPTIGVFQTGNTLAYTHIATGEIVVDASEVVRWGGFNDPIVMRYWLKRAVIHEARHAEQRRTGRLAQVNRQLLDAAREKLAIAKHNLDLWYKQNPVAGRQIKAALNVVFTEIMPRYKKRYEAETMKAIEGVQKAGREFQPMLMAQVMRALANLRSIHEDYQAELTRLSGNLAMTEAQLTKWRELWQARQDAIAERDAQMYEEEEYEKEAIEIEQAVRLSEPLMMWLSQWQNFTLMSPAAMDRLLRYPSSSGRVYPNASTESIAFQYIDEAIQRFPSNAVFLQAEPEAVVSKGMWLPLKEKFKTDEEGNLVRDKNGNPVSEGAELQDWMDVESDTMFPIFSMLPAWKNLILLNSAGTNSRTALHEIFHNTTLLMTSIYYEGYFSQNSENLYGDELFRKDIETLMALAGFTPEQLARSSLREKIHYFESAAEMLEAFTADPEFLSRVGEKWVQNADAILGAYGQDTTMTYAQALARIQGRANKLTRASAMTADPLMARKVKSALWRMTTAVDYSKISTLQAAAIHSVAGYQDPDEPNPTELPADPRAVPKEVVDGEFQNRADHADVQGEPDMTDEELNRAFTDEEMMERFKEMISTVMDNEFIAPKGGFNQLVGYEHSMHPGQAMITQAETMEKAGMSEEEIAKATRLVRMPVNAAKRQGKPLSEWAYMLPDNYQLTGYTLKDTLWPVIAHEASAGRDLFMASKSQTTNGEVPFRSYDFSANQLYVVSSPTIQALKDKALNGELTPEIEAAVNRWTDSVTGYAELKRIYPEVFDPNKGYYFRFTNVGIATPNMGNAIGTSSSTMITVHLMRVLSYAQQRFENWMGIKLKVPPTGRQRVEQRLGYEGAPFDVIQGLFMKYPEFQLEFWGGMAELVNHEIHHSISELEGWPTGWATGIAQGLTDDFYVQLRRPGEPMFKKFTKRKGRIKDRDDGTFAWKNIPPTRPWGWQSPADIPDYYRDKYANRSSKWWDAKYQEWFEHHRERVFIPATEEVNKPRPREESATNLKLTASDLYRYNTGEQRANYVGGYAEGLGNSSRGRTIDDVYGNMPRTDSDAWMTWAYGPGTYALHYKPTAASRNEDVVRWMGEGDRVSDLNKRASLYGSYLTFRQVEGEYGNAPLPTNSEFVKAANAFNVPMYVDEGGNARLKGYPRPAFGFIFPTAYTTGVEPFRIGETAFNAVLPDRSTLVDLSSPMEAQSAAVKAAIADAERDFGVAFTSRYDGTVSGALAAVDYALAQENPGALIDTVAAEWWSSRGVKGQINAASDAVIWDAHSIQLEDARTTQKYRGVVVTEDQRPVVVFRPDGYHDVAIDNMQTWNAGLTLAAMSLEFPEATVEAQDAVRAAVLKSLTLPDKSGIEQLGFKGESGTVDFATSQNGWTLARDGKMGEGLKAAILAQVDGEAAALVEGHEDVWGAFADQMSTIYETGFKAPFVEEERIPNTFMQAATDAPATEAEQGVIDAVFEDALTADEGGAGLNSLLTQLGAWGHNYTVRKGLGLNIEELAQKGGKMKWGAFKTFVSGLQGWTEDMAKELIWNIPKDKEGTPVLWTSSRAKDVPGFKDWCAKAGVTTLEFIDLMEQWLQTLDPNKMEVNAHIELDANSYKALAAILPQKVLRAYVWKRATVAKGIANSEQATMDDKLAAKAELDFINTEIYGIPKPKTAEEKAQEKAKKDEERAEKETEGESQESWANQMGLSFLTRLEAILEATEDKVAELEDALEEDPENVSIQKALDKMNAALQARNYVLSAYEKGVKRSKNIQKLIEESEWKGGKQLGKATWDINQRYAIDRKKAAALMKRNILKICKDIARIQNDSRIDINTKDEIKKLLIGLKVNKRSIKPVPMDEEQKAQLTQLMASTVSELASGQIPYIFGDMDLDKFGRLTLGDLMQLHEQVMALGQLGRERYLEWQARIDENTMLWGNQLREGLSEEQKLDPKTGKPIKGDSIYFSLLNPQNLARLLGGGKMDNTWNRFFLHSENEARNIQLYNQRERYRWMQRHMARLGITLQSLARIVGKVGVREYTADEVMDMYVSMKRQAKANALVGGNFRNDHKMDREQALPEINRLISLLTPQEIEFADLHINEYDMHYKRINRVFRDIYNRSYSREEFYSSMHRRRRSKATESDIINEEMIGLLLNGNPQNAAYAKIADSFTREVMDIDDEHQTPLDLGLHKNWTYDVRQQEHAHAYAKFARDGILVLSSKNEKGVSIAQQIVDTYGSPAWENFHGWFNAAVTDSSRLSRNMFDNYFGNWAELTAIAGLAGNIMVSFKNFTGLFRFGVSIDGKPLAHPAELAASIVRFLQNPIAFRDRVYEKAPQIENRMGNAYIKAAHEMAAGQKTTKYREILADLMTWATGMDRYVSAIGWEASYNTYKKRNPKVTEQDAMRYADQAVQMTQNPVDLRDAPAWGRQPGIARLNLIFTSDSLAMLNTVMSSIYGEVKEGKYGSAIRSVVTLGLTAMLFALITQGPPDDDEDETIMGWTRRALVSDVLRMVPLAGSDFAQMYMNWDKTGTVSLVYGGGSSWSPIVRNVLLTLDATQEFWEGDKDRIDTARKFVESAMGMLSFKMRIPTALYNNIIKAGFDVAAGEYGYAARDIMGGLFGRPKLDQ